ncbi:glucose 1-dehydrogenase [Jeotgalibaca porci]|uniref:Glucose 1-dehydrogenase n=1 Tax=Jeotgalibaca porci TaxID=1868793 RepID=A0A6G7WHZ1_9LACT|nr:glucose 1-dehydrogenase [Jeotgalibaca porci]QIK51885.1 glucose 1-dehydrogenase [Jeotgalibaca porci]
MSERLTDKVAVVTGGASGIGEATVRKFVAEGAKVVIGDLNKERGQALAEELGDAAIFVAIDVTKASDWEEVKKQALEAFGTVDVLVNNAGISVAQSLLTMTEEQYRKILEINQVSVFLGMQKIAPIMIEKGAGSIINTSSINGLKAGAIGYTDSKFAVRGMTKAASAELAPQGVRVNSIHPGIIETPMTMEGDAVEQIKAYTNFVPMRRMAQAEEVANLMLYLASDESSYSTGSEFIVDGGLTQ